MQRALAALLALVPLIACGPVGPGPDADEPTDAPTAAIRVTTGNELLPLTATLPDVPIGTTGTATFQVESVGDVPLVLTNLQTEPAEFAVEPFGDAPLQPGEVLDILVSFTPSSEGPADGVVRLSTNATNAPTVDVLLRGAGVEAELAFGGISVLFNPPVPVGCSRTVPVALRNNLETDVPISVEIVPPVAGLSLAFDGGPASSIAAGELLVGDLSWTPLAAGTIDTQVVVEAASPGGSLLRLPVAGEAEAADAWTDSYIVGPRPVDLLLVVDALPLWGTPTTQLAMQTIIDGLNATAPVWRIAVLTADPGLGGGPVVGTPPVLDPLATDPANELAARLDAAALTGDGRAFDAVHQALLDSSGPLADFGSGPAVLGVLFWSDIDEASTHPEVADPDDFVAWLDGLNAAKNSLNLSAFTGGAAGCSGATGDALPGPAYAAATEATGGFNESYCSSPKNFMFSVLTNSLLQDLTHLGYFALSAVPQVESTLVSISAGGGTPVPTGAWSYNGTENRVELWDPVPAAGETVLIEYPEGPCGAP